MSKVLLVGPAHPLRGGIAASTEILARTLQQQGHQVDILSFKLQYPSLLFPGKTQLSESEVPQDLNILPWLNSVNPLNWMLVSRKIAKGNYDWAMIRYWMPFFSPSLSMVASALRKKGTKVLTLADNVIPHEHRPGDTLLTRRFLKRVDGAVVMSRSVEEDIKSFFPDKPCLYHPHPIYDQYGDLLDKGQARDKLGLEKDDKYLLFFGLIRKYKGLDLLLDAMEHQILKEMNVKLLVIGEFYDSEEECREKIQEKRLEDRVIIENRFVRDDEVNIYFSAADLVVQPYLTATQSGISQIAYHFNKPMVVTHVGGLPEIVPDGKVGYVVEVKSQAVAQAIADFYNQHKEAEFTANIQEEKKRFSWLVMVEAVEGFLSGLREDV